MWERAQLRLTVWTDTELKGKQGYGGQKEQERRWDPLFGPHTFLEVNWGPADVVGGDQGCFGASPCRVSSQLRRVKAATLVSVKSLKVNRAQSSLHEQIMSESQFSVENT